VELGGDRRGVATGAEDADPARDVAAEVADERGEVAARLDRGDPTRPCLQPGRDRGPSDDDEQVH
jgi:hypothetical protein